MRDAHDAEITRLIDEQMAAWNRGDAEGFAATAQDDLGFTNIRGQRWVGRKPFVDAHHRILTGIYAGSELRAQVERIAFPGSGVAVAECLLRLSGAKAMPPGITADADNVLHTRLLEIFEWRDDRWTLTVYHNMAVLT